MSSFYPVFRYPNARAAVDFLRTAFGLSVEEVHEGPDGEVRHAQLRYGDDLIMLAPGAGPPTRPADDDHRIYVVVDDIDAHHERAAAPVRRSWSSRSTPTTAPATTRPGT